MTKKESTSKTLAPIQKARRALAVMEDPRKVKDYHDKAAAIRDYYARHDQSLDLANDAAEVMLWSRRRLGELFLGLPKDKGGRPAKNSDTPVSELQEARKELGVGEAIVRYWQQESRVDEADLVAWLAETREAHEQITAEGLRRFVGSGGILATKHTGEMEWYTPEEHIERVRKVIGTIDLDPASSKFAQKIVKAGTFYTEADDGLTQAWFGNVFLNPPYKQPAASLFVNRLADDYEGSAVDAAILLTNSNTDTDWWQRAAGLASAVCFTDGRISFYNAAGDWSSPTNGQTFCYLGKQPAKFRRVFDEVGLCMPQ